MRDISTYVVRILVRWDGSDPERESEILGTVGFIGFELHLDDWYSYDEVLGLLVKAVGLGGDCSVGDLVSVICDRLKCGGIVSTSGIVSCREVGYCGGGFGSSGDVEVPFSIVLNWGDSILL